MLMLFKRYASIGVINTLLHWAIFFVVHSFGVTQAQSNMVAFLVSVTFSYFANARFTFKKQATSYSYMIFIAFMGAMAGITGKASDCMQLPSIVTLVIFSALSLVIGFFYSKNIVFRARK